MIRGYTSTYLNGSPVHILKFKLAVCLFKEFWMAMFSTIYITLPSI
jgi:hypothetical protein